MYRMTGAVYNTVRWPDCQHESAFVLQGLGVVEAVVLKGVWMLINIV